MEIDVQLFLYDNGNGNFVKKGSGGSGTQFPGKLGSKIWR